jgi:type IV pilus assembly protein PilN
MIAINLLDWRSKYIHIQNTRFYIVVGVVVSVCAIATLSTLLIINSMISIVNQDITYLGTELVMVEGKIQDIKDLQEKKSVLLSRRQVIESLQSNRSLAVIIFDNLIRAVPDGVVLDSLSRKETELTLSGNSDSNYSITIFMENMQKLPWVKDAKLTEIKTNTYTDQSTDGAKAAAAVDQNRSQISFQMKVTINEDS